MVCTSLLTALSIKLVEMAGKALREGNPELVGAVCLGIVALFGIKYWFTRGQVYFLSLAANRLATDLRVRLFEKLQKLPISYFNERRSGAIQSVFTNDVNVYQTAVTIVRDSIDGPIKAIAALVMIVVIQWKLALIAALFLPIMALAIQRNGRKMRVAQRAVQDELSDLNATTNEVLQGTRVIKAFAAEDRIVANYREQAERTFLTQMQAVYRQATLRPLVELIGAVGLGVVLYLGGHLAAQGELEIEQLLALVMALDVINQGMRNLASVGNTYNQVQAASERIYREVFDQPDQHAEAEGRMPEAPRGEIEFRNVSFAYPDGTQALRDVSFRLEPGSSLALVGPSGAGKSTIADLLLRFYEPASGTILFDGVDVRELDIGWLRRQIGVVPQHTFLFAGTLSENIRLGRPDAPPEAVHEAARLAHAEEFIRTMPKGFETELGERGVRLSGGQMQRVAIARAVIRKPEVLLLDEATSALDAESEKAVQEALAEVMRGRTTLLIAHRLTSAARADRILMLSRGEVLEQGSHAELMAHNGPYAGMYSAFSSGVFEDGP